ncbi:MAG TPA: FUSC family protein [Burkholderiaceae bacterium]
MASLGWRRLPSHLVNGASVAAGIALVQLLFGALAGFHAAQLASTGAVCVSLADLPNTPGRARRQLAAAVIGSGVAGLAVTLLAPWPPALGIAVALIGFAAMMTLAWGPRAGPVAFSAVLAVVFTMALPAPARGQLGALVAWTGLGALAYFAWAQATTLLLQPRYRTLALGAALGATANLLRARAAVLDPAVEQSAEVLRAAVGAEAALAERLQSARDLLFEAPDTPAARRATAILLRTIDLRDVLLASRLDADSPLAGRALLAGRLRAIGGALDAFEDAVRSGRPATAPAPAAPLDIASEHRERLLLLEADVARIGALVRGGDEPLPLEPAQLRRFVAPEAWPLSAFAPHRSLRSPVLRHALRVGLALSCAWAIGRSLPWASHPHWLVLSVAVVLRGNLEQTLSRRNARVLGTVLGCLVVLALAFVPSRHALAAVFLVSAGVAHAFVNVRYLLTATAASVMALLQSHLVDPAGGFAVAERLADTFLGAALAWGFSYVLPSWERRTLPDAVARALQALAQYAQHTLTAAPESAVAQRLARRRAYDALGAITAAVQRSGVEPARVRVPLAEVLALLDQSHRLMAHLSMIRLQLARRIGPRSAAQDQVLREGGRALVAALTAGAAPLGVPDASALPDAPPGLAERLQVALHEAGAVCGAAAALRTALARDA